MKNIRSFEVDTMLPSWQTAIGVLPEGFCIAIDSSGESTQLCVHYNGEGCRRLALPEQHVNGEGVLLGSCKVPFDKAFNLPDAERIEVQTFVSRTVQSAVDRLTPPQA